MDALPSERRWVCLVPKALRFYPEEERYFKLPFVYSEFVDEPDTIPYEMLNLYLVVLLKVPPFHFGDLWKNIPWSRDDSLSEYDAPSLLFWLFTTYAVWSHPEEVSAAHKQMKALSVRGYSNAKLTYLMNQLCTHIPHEKCVVYISGVGDFREVSGFTSMIQIQSANGMYTKWFTFPDYNVYSEDDNGKDAIAKAVAEFTTNDHCWVIFMPTWMLFWGVDLTIATRVYLYSPVWYDSIEAQIIQRVHHIGQIRTVHIETLVLRGTLEDAALEFKDKPIRIEDYETRWAESTCDRVVLALGEFLTPAWKKEEAIDDRLPHDGCATMRLETFTTSVSADTSSTTIEVSSRQPTPWDDNLQL
ncbi:hypothetical protein IWQ62_002147 [Dispira parvispora]|uniref:Uncharacterized protein n=1 Tax=Dispira parvispora TaxID=1520584 RepID=A0A9W8E7S9_9FUNG|nr:hypothetical protein IWQ62_002147 [Dispira parvispora]